MERISRMRLGALRHGLLVLAGIALPVMALPAQETPTSLHGATVVAAEKAKALVDGRATIVDTRVAAEYFEQHIKGAVSVPYKENSGKSVDFDAGVDSFDLTKLPADKKAPVIFYCNGPECWKSYKSSVTAVKAGYKNVYWLRGGIPEWKAKGLPVE